MLPRSVLADIAAVDRMLELTRALPIETSGEIKSMICQHICVVIAGRLEQGIKEILQEHVRSKSSVDLDRAITKLCNGFQNPKPDKILELLDIFNRDFKKSLSDEWELDEGGESSNLKAMISKRINIAHQKNRHESVSIEAATEYAQIYKRLVAKICDGLN